MENKKKKKKQVLKDHFYLSQVPEDKRQEEDAVL